MSTNTEMVHVPIVVRRARAADFDGVYSLYMDSGNNPYLIFDPMPPEDFRPVFEELMNGRELHVYEEGGMIVGALTVTRGTLRMSHVASLGTIAVHHDSHGTGVGAAFVSRILAELASEGIHRVELTVDVDNPGAIAFYENLGFCREGLMHDYVKRDGENGYVDNFMMATILESSHAKS